mmetsp:Transcript_56465/g.103612  ORF Transcript_56465/g.103612 Transcript_56465/m.103612 type:complete len:384 (-) Transcript_56465:58-1209(-)
MGNSPCVSDACGRGDARLQEETARSLEEQAPLTKPTLRKSKSRVDLNDVVRFENLPLEEDTYGMMVCSLVRDTYFWSRGVFGQRRRYRLAVVGTLIVFTMFLQVLLLAKVKEFVSARAVHDIRQQYHDFELTMCRENVSKTKHNHVRCNANAFPPLDVARARLLEFNETEQAGICNIPLSQPVFFGSVLLLWTLTCVAELRKAFSRQWTIWHLETIQAMRNAEKPEILDILQQETVPGQGSELVIRGLTNQLKQAITLFIFAPRVCITLYLLWVGCRWLLATNHFSDLVLNALALEFILLLKEGVYNALMPARSKRDLELTKFHPVWTRQTPNALAYMNTIFLLFLSIAWVASYMLYFQTVLPDYNSDIQEVCDDWLHEHYEV